MSGQLQASIHTGTCAEPGGGLAELEPFFTDERGSGEMSVITPLDAAAVRGGDPVLLLQQPERQPDPIVACGSIAAAGVEQG